MNLDDKLIDSEVKRQLEILQDTPPREQGNVLAGRQNFLNMAASIKRPVSIASEKRLNKWIPIINRKERRSMLTALAALVVSVVMLFGGASATVYAAQDSKPDDLLYRVKTWSEDVHLSLTNNPQAKFNLVEGYVLRRFSETDSMVDEAKPIPSRLVTRTENQLNYMLQLASNLKDDEEMESALLRVRSMLQDRLQLMINQSENIPEWGDPAYAQIQQMLNERLRWIETGIGEPMKFRQQMESPSGGFGSGPGTGSGNPEEISPPPTRKVEDKPFGPDPCDTAQEDHGCINEPEHNSPTEDPISDENHGHHKSGDSANQENNFSDGNGSNGGGKP